MPIVFVVHGSYSQDTFKKISEENKNHKNGKNCRLITIDQFLDLFRFGKYAKTMSQLSELSAEAIGKDDKYKTLREFHISNPNLLQDSY